MTSNHTTRDQWLEAAVKELNQKVFAPAGVETLDAAWNISCSWPGGGSARKRIGECWPSAYSSKDIREMFISPTLSDELEVLAVVAHEMIHAIDNCENGHKGPFRRMALAIGLTGKMTATVAGSDLLITLKKIFNTLGDYPHAAMNLADRKKQTTRMIKLECVDCGFIARASRSAIEKAGLPTCGCGGYIQDV